MDYILYNTFYESSLSVYLKSQGDSSFLLDQLIRILILVETKNSIVNNYIFIFNIQKFKCILKRTVSSDRPKIRFR